MLLLLSTDKIGVIRGRHGGEQRTNASNILNRGEGTNMSKGKGRRKFDRQFVFELAAAVVAVD